MNSIAFTDSEKTIYEMIANGKTTNEIAEILKISKHCVRSHEIRILAKVGISDIGGYAINCYSKNIGDIVRYTHSRG